MPKTMIYKDDNTGEKYKISWSEELQLKNLNAVKKQVRWQKVNFFGMMILFSVLLLLVVIVSYTLFKLDSIDFFTRVAYR